MKPCRTTTFFSRFSRLGWFLYTYTIWAICHVCIALETLVAILLRTRDICSIYLFRNMKILIKYNKWSQTCLHLFSKPVGVGYRYQPYLRTLWSAGGKSAIKLRCKTWRRNTYHCPTEKASTNVESCLVMSIAHMWILAMHMFRSLRRCSLRGPSQECRDTHRAGLQVACLEKEFLGGCRGCTYRRRW